MNPRELVAYAHKPGLLGRLSGGRVGRAALVLIGTYLVLPVVCVLLWVVGLAPVFARAHWIVAILATVIFLAMLMWVGLAFGFWGTGAYSGRDGGDQFGGDFTPGAATGLGWLRWFMQVVGIGACAIPLVALWSDARWWHLVSRPEIDGLQDRAATMPIPRGWTPTSSVLSATPPGLPQDVYEFEQGFDVPNRYTAAAFKKWLESPRWRASFGALQEIECDRDIGRCEADVTPPPGEDVRFSVELWYAPSVRVKLQYWPHGPDV